jgi:hypothetical protein
VHGVVANPRVERHNCEVVPFTRIGGGSRSGGSVSSDTQPEHHDRYAAGDHPCPHHAETLTGRIKWPSGL